jgi:peroxiredoxin
LVIDGKVNTVISGTAVQREKLQAALNKLEQEGEINYGLYVSRESVMSCYVRNLNEEHIHFVDGAEGGYTKAAGMLKRKGNLSTS